MSVRECLPVEFVASMRSQLGDETEGFLSSYEREAYSGIRINTGKIPVREATEKLPFIRGSVPWTENGFYVSGTSISRHPWYYAGLYYIQEPSAMLPASLLPIAPGDRVLDLCAAPGGKATELASRLRGNGLLVANDVSASRAKALVKNLAVWGTANACVTAETPERLYGAFGCFFDKILVDAPCSGEGMFRKDSSLIASWKERGPRDYAPLQKEILSWAVRMLKPGGMLLYSTCTFSKEEDEDVIADTLERFPELTLVPVKKKDGFAPGIGLESCIRLYPHRADGEGHFAALLQKRPTERRDEPCEQEGIVSISQRKKDKSAAARARGESTGKNIKQLPEPVREFLARISYAEDFPLKAVLETFLYEQVGDSCLLLPPFDFPRSIRYLRTGVKIGSLKRGRFEPSQELAMLLDASCFEAVLDMETDDERVLRYLKGETIALKETEPDRTGEGWVLVCADGHGLGWGKYGNGSLKNKYYPGWRLQ
ncbi:MAG: RsmB/NOP family class I SAM-dependent RNA methyltransferase [Lachnospiraceae bacterium]|nr:RsmB/NOP family class I SAM-dependent RNA methyltransferase [Lachnospiraceae bacterium]